MTKLHPIEEPNPSGLCQCGCGEKAPIAAKSIYASGWVQGKPMRYIQGHWAKTNMNKEEYLVTSDGCWLWQRSLSGGYARARVQGRMTLIYKHNWEQENGPVPKDMQLDHICKNRSCCNPEHLELVTPAENVRRGKLSKLTVQDVREIKARSSNGETVAHLSREFNVHTHTVYSILSGRTWKDIRV